MTSNLSAVSHHHNRQDSVAMNDGLAHALAITGDRWTLHLVSGLLSGPKRFGELAEALPGIAPNVLTARLRHLEREGPDLGNAIQPAAAAARLRPHGIGPRTQRRHLVVDRLGRSPTQRLRRHTPRRVRHTARSPPVLLDLRAAGRRRSSRTAPLAVTGRQRLAGQQGVEGEVLRYPDTLNRNGATGGQHDRPRTPAGRVTSRLWGRAPRVHQPSGVSNLLTRLW